MVLAAYGTPEGPFSLRTRPARTLPWLLAGGKEQRERERLEPTDEESALAWARKRADVVVIRVLESHPYSAGTVNPWGGPEWPGLQAARANAFIGPTPNDP
jgi:hypothetical protein